MMDRKLSYRGEKIMDKNETYQLKLVKPLYYGCTNAGAVHAQWRNSTVEGSGSQLASVFVVHAWKQLQAQGACSTNNTLRYMIIYHAAQVFTRKEKTKDEPSKLLNDCVAVM